MVLSLRAEPTPNSIEVVLEKFLEKFTASMKTWTDQFVESMKQARPNSNPKHNQRMLICGATQEDDCLCVVAESMESEFYEKDEHEDAMVTSEEEEVNPFTRDIDQAGNEDVENADQIVPAVDDLNVIRTEIGDFNPQIHQVVNQLDHSKVNSLPICDFLSPKLVASTMEREFVANKEMICVEGKVFDENTERNGYIISLDPDPPDDYATWLMINESTESPSRLLLSYMLNSGTGFGALPVFIVDGNPSPLKSQTRIGRFFRGSGIDLLSLPVSKDDISVERNDKFLKSVQERIELLKLLGMPVLKSTREAEAPCAQINKEGHVDACITADSDTFLFGADCIIKCLRPNSKEPFECYYMSDIEAGLGLKRKHLIDISLLVGNDYKLNGVQGIGPNTALRCVKSFSEDEILNRLHEIGRGDTIQFPSGSIGDFIPSSNANSQKAKFPHCSLCGHPRSKRSHLKFDCEFCSPSPSTTEGCIKKPMGFKYSCSSCDTERKQNELKKNENWQMKVCKKNSMEQNFPNDEIIGIYLSNNQGNFIDVGQLCWEDPNTEMLVDFLAYQQSGEPSYIRQMMLPMLSTIFLRKMALNPSNDLLHGQYMFDSIKRVKVRFVTGHSSTTISAGLGMAGHIINDLIAILKEFKSNKTTGPVLIHVIIEKGRGYPYAKKAADKYHGVAKFDPVIGKQFNDNAKTQPYITYFMEALIAKAERDKGVVAIHVVMGGGITGLAREGLKPFCAIYSSFLQRANDQIVHDVYLQKLPVRFAMDRVELVGADGPTHSGSFDVTYMKFFLSNCSSFAKSLSERVYEVVFCSIDEAHVAGFTKDNGILLISFSTAYVPVYALLPLGIINMECELIDHDDVLNQSKILKPVNIDWVMVDCWWGIVEAHTPQHYKWNGYKNHFQLKLQVMTFPECGGNVDDDVHIPHPQWIFFMNRKGRRNSECLTWDVDKEEKKDPNRYFKWTVFGTTNLLGVPKQVILIYGQFPGSRLDVDTNDNIIINQQDELFLLTWNGVKQRKDYWQDGVLGTNSPTPHLHFYPP